MPTSQLVVSWILGLTLAAGNLWFWWWVARRGEARFKAWVERRFRVSIGQSWRGHWKVTGPRSGLARFGLEMLQLAFYLAAILAWGVMIAAGVGLMALVDRLW